MAIYSGDTGNPSRKKSPMDEDRIKAIVKQEIQSAVGYVGGELSEQRRKSMEYYMGEKFGNEVEGRSEVVDTTVQDVVESAMPDFVEMFASGDQAVSFAPVGKEDVEQAKQASDMVNHVWLHDNDGYGITHDWIKDGLLQKNGFIKVYWDESERKTKETFENLNTVGLQALVEDEEVEIIEAEERQAEEHELEFAPDGVIYDVTAERTTTKGRVKVFGLPPEEFLISRRAVTLDDSIFLAHKFRETVSNLRAMGYSDEALSRVSSTDDHDYNEERTARFDADDEYPDQDHALDESTRQVWVYECYVLMDADGDGIAERRVITVAGSGYEILDNREVDDHPFVSLTPIRMGHKFFGRSLADLTADLQELKSTVWRQLMDNMYLQNNARVGVNDQVNLDDILTNRPGGVVRVRGAIPPAQAITPIVTPPLGNHAFPVLEYLDNVRELRTGITRYSQGMDAEALNKTARGLNMMLGRSQKRMLLMARTMAEGGFKQAMQKILRLLIHHQDYERTVRLRGEWVAVSPKSWNADMDVIVHVGLGHGTKEDQAMVYQNILAAQERIVQLQGGPTGPLVTMDNVYSTLREATSAAGVKNTDLHFTDPSSPEAKAIMAAKAQQPPPPDPKMVEVQAKMQLERAKAEFEAKKEEAEHARHTQDDRAKQEREMEKIRLEHERKLIEIQLEDQRERLKAGLELDIKEAEIDATLRMQRVQGEQSLEVEREKGAMQAEVERTKGEQKNQLERDRFEADRETKNAPAKSLDNAAKELAGAKEELAEAADAVGEAVKKLDAPKTVVYNDKNEVVGVKVGDETKKVTRDGQGRVKGLE